MEEAIKVADPDRWQRHILRRHQEESAAEKAEQEVVPRETAHHAVADEQATPQASEGEDDDAEDLFRDLEEEEPGGQDAGVGHSPSACTALASQGLSGHADLEGGLTEVLCRVDMCEVFSPPRVGAEARKFGLTRGDAMDLTTGWDFNKEEHRRKTQ